jgi:hypothetical protein
MIESEPRTTIETSAIIIVIRTIISYSLNVELKAAREPHAR